MVKKLVAVISAGMVIACTIALVTDSQENLIRSRVVKLKGAHGMCSGEQIRTDSGQDYILTAAHCRHFEENGSITVINESGQSIQRRVIAEDINSDLLLLEGLPNMKGLAIAKNSYNRQRVRTFTHGRNLPTYETQGVLIGDTLVKVPVKIISTEEEAAACVAMPKYKIEENIFARFCVLAVQEMGTTALIVPGSSGGVVVDSSGDVVGVASASGDNFGWLVTLGDIQRFLAAY